MSTSPLNEHQLRSFKNWSHMFFFAGPEKLLRKAIDQNKIDYAAHLLSQGYGRDALYHAVAKNDLVRTKRLVEAGADINALPAKQGTTPLVLAAAWGHLDILKYLIAQGADLNVRSDKHNTALICAARNDHIAAVAALLEAGAAVDLQGEHERTALIWAGIKGRRDIAALLTQYNADPTIRGGNDGRLTPAEWAANNRHRNTAALLSEYQQNWQPGPATAALAYKKPLALPAPGHHAEAAASPELPPGWSVIRQPGVEIVIQTICDEAGGTTIKNVFDFSGDRLLTEFSSAGNPPSLSEKPLSAVKAEFLDSARAVLKQAGATSGPSNDMKLT